MLDLFGCVKVFQAQFSRHDNIRSLCAFTVPEELCPLCKPAVEQWQETMASQWQTSILTNALSQCRIVTTRLPPHRVQL